MSNKHDANVRKSAVVNFQIGLIASLLFTFTMFELYTSDQSIIVSIPEAPVEDPVVVWSYQFKEYVAPKSETVEQKPIAAVINPRVFRIVPDPTIINKTARQVVDAPSVATSKFDPNSLAIVDDPDVDPLVRLPFDAVEEVPVFPGCEGLVTNKEKAACFNEKVSRIISRKFNTDIGSRYGLKGKQKIYTVFDVSPDGTVQNIQVRAPHPKLKQEAERVIGLFPKMKPGMQREMPVTVKYQLPIVFKVEQ